MRRVRWVHAPLVLPLRLLLVGCVALRGPAAWHGLGHRAGIDATVTRPSINLISTSGQPILSGVLPVR